MLTKCDLCGPSENLVKIELIVYKMIIKTSLGSIFWNCTINAMIITIISHVHFSNNWFLLRSNWLLVLVMGYKFAITNSVRALWYTCSNVCMSHLYSPVTRQKFGFELTAPKNLMICLWLSMLRMLAYYNRRGRLIRLHWGIIHSGH